MGKAIRNRAKAESNLVEEKESAQINPLRINPLENISGIAYDMELQIRDAIGVARTAKHRSNDAESECEDYCCSAALDLIMYQLEQIQEGHALIVKNAPYRDYVPGEKGELS